MPLQNQNLGNDRFKDNNNNNNNNGNGWVLEFCVHTAYYVIHCDVADWALGAIYYC